MTRKEKTITGFILAVNLIAGIALVTKVDIDRLLGDTAAAPSETQPSETRPGERIAFEKQRPIVTEPSIPQPVD